MSSLSYFIAELGPDALIVLGAVVLYITLLYMAKRWPPTRGRHSSW